MSTHEVVETASQLNHTMFTLRIAQKLIMLSADPIQGMEFERGFADLRKLYKQALPKEYTAMFSLQFDSMYHRAIWKASEIEEVRERAKEQSYGINKTWTKTK